MSLPTPCSTLQGRNHGGGWAGGGGGGLEIDTDGPEERACLSFLELHWFFSPLLNGSGPSWALPLFFFFLPLLPVICPCFSIPSLTLFPLPAPDFFLFLSSSHPSACWEGFAGWEGKGWGGWSYSNSAGDQCQAQVLSPWWRLSGKKSEMQKRIKNKEGNPG